MSRLGTLRVRLGLLYAALAAAMLVVAYVVAGAAVEAALINSAAERLEIEAGLVVADATGRRQPTATDLAASDLAMVLGGYGTAVAIVDGAGQVLASEPNGATDAVLEARLEAADYARVISTRETVRAVRPGTDGHRTLVVASPVQLRTAGASGSNGQGRGNGNGNGNGPPASADAPPNAVAQLAISLDALDATVTAVRAQLQVAALALLVLAAVAVWLVIRYGLRPLNRIADAADSIAAGNLGARAALPSGDDEVGRLGRAFDGMAERVDATLRAQRAFAADASHELRSPLTVLGGYVDVLAARDGIAASDAATLAAMRREIDRLSRLSADLLLLTQIEAGGGRLEPRLLDLRELTEDIGAAARVMGPDRRIDVVADAPLPVLADPDRITQSVMNLIDNAIRHTPSGGRIVITASQQEGRAVLSVANTGPAIPAQDLPRVFDRFFRSSGGAEGRNGQHAGLGLAIFKATVEASGGTVGVTSDSTETRFAMHLPLAT